MAGKVILIAFTCAISGLFITALTSPKRLTPVPTKPCGIGSFAWSPDDGHSEAGRFSDAERRTLLKTAPIENDPDEEKYREGRRATSEQSMGKEKQIDPALMVSVESLMKKHKLMDGVMLVDVRESRTFEQCHIPGSINVALHAVKTKSFLQSTVLILVNEGFPSAHLEEQCRQLRNSGFMVWILEGGLNAWKESGRPLESECPTQSSLNRLSPQNLFEERDSDRWIAVDARRLQKTEEALPFSKVIPLGASDNAEGSVVTLMNFLKTNTTQSPLFFVVFDEDGMQYEKVEMIIRKAGIKNAFYLTDGLEAYSAFLSHRAAILRKTDHSRNTVGKCVGCP